MVSYYMECRFMIQGLISVLLRGLGKTEMPGGYIG